MNAPGTFPSPGVDAGDPRRERRGSANGAERSAPFEVNRAGALVALLRLHWFINVRWLITAVGLAALGIERLAAASARRPAGLWYVVAAIGVVNLSWTMVSHFLRRRFQDVPGAEREAIYTARLFANAQVATDLLLLTLVLRYTGGVEGPMAMFYIFHMAIGALVLRAPQAVAQGVWAILLFAALGVGELRGWIAPHHEFLPALTHPGQYTDPEYVALVVLVVGCGIFGTLFLSLRVVARLDDRENRLLTTLAVLRRSQHAIQDLQARRSRFMQTAAHQLKSPLAGIQTLANLIRDGVVQGDAVTRTCGKIGRRCRDGIHAVSELLTLARVQDADPVRHEAALVEVGDVVLEVCLRRSAQAEAAGIELTCQVLSDASLRAHVQRADLADCVDNLVDNAIKYTPAPGQVKVTVEKRSPESAARADEGVIGRGELQRASAYVAVVVQDTGMGIDPSEFAVADSAGSVFDAFRRGNQALAAGIPGSGLGLSIVRAVVEQAGGQIQVRSGCGKGSTFTVMFPAELSLPVGPRVRDTRASEVIIETEGRDGGAVNPPAKEPDHAR